MINYSNYFKYNVSYYILHDKISKSNEKSCRTRPTRTNLSKGMTAQ